jgi:hypothetical protein
MVSTVLSLDIIQIFLFVGKYENNLRIIKLLSSLPLPTLRRHVCVFITPFHFVQLYANRVTQISREESIEGFMCI